MRNSESKGKSSKRKSRQSWEEIASQGTNRQNEKAMVDKCIKHVNSLKGCMARKRHPGANRTGEPDITGCLRGRRLEVEAKVGNNKPTKIQEAMLGKYARSGAATATVWTYEAFVEFVDSILKRKRIFDTEDRVIYPKN